MLKFKRKTTNAGPVNQINTRPPRYRTVARVRINGFEGEAVLRNINEGGFCMESRTYAAISPGEHYIMLICPEKSAEIPCFELEVEGRWIRSTEKTFSAGFLIVKSPVDHSMERYMNHLKRHGKIES
jgi:hypothetical protein